MTQKSNSTSQLIASSPLAWVLLNNLVTENQRPIEYDTHRYMIDPMADMHPDQVWIKSAQLGGSVAMILKSIHACKYLGTNIGYILPSQNIARDFVMPKVDPLISSNAAIRDVVTKDSITLKQIGDRFLYFRGAFSEREAIAISLDILVLDELDRMPNMNIVNTYDSRLQASLFAYRWRLSNPSAIGFGVDALFRDSDQMHWMVKCRHCNYTWFVDFANDGECHYLDQERIMYVCNKCSKEITAEDRRMGKWVAKYPSRKRRGYWMSQMIVPYVTPVKILEQYKESSPDFFANFVLGKAYTPSDLVINRDTILKANSPSSIDKHDVAMGVDNGVVKSWVLGTVDGIFAHGQTESWDEIEHLKLTYNAMLVMDPNPYPTTPKVLVQKYPGSAFICYFKRDTTGLSIVEWGKRDKVGVVYSDRTKIIDLVAQEIIDGKILFREHPNKLEDMIYHWENIYRTTVEETDGRMRSAWLKKEGKPSDLNFAMVYWRIALSRLINREENSVLKPKMADMSSRIQEAME